VSSKFSILKEVQLAEINKVPVTTKSQQNIPLNQYKHIQIVTMHQHLSHQSTS
jgi:hypothetical protein